MTSDQTEMLPGTNRDKEASQWFTPPELAERVVEWARVAKAVQGIPRPIRVLEPSAGNGALVRPLVAAGACVEAVEADLRYVSDLANVLGLGERAHRMHCPCDFLKQRPDPRFDLVVTNPPYEHGQDVAFILHALKFAPRVVGIFRSALLHGKERKHALWQHVRLTRIAFLSERPKFGKGDKADSARSDFIVAELVERERWRAGEIERVAMEWW